MKRILLVVSILSGFSVATNSAEIVWKIASPSGRLESNTYTRLEDCQRALKNYEKGSSCVAIPKK
ncbi:MAG: hypothetical protein ABL933_17790 [Methyloglobulus sp.]